MKAGITWLYAGAACALAFAGAPAAAEPADMVELERYKVHAVHTGSGPYTVIFEAGFGSDLSAWRKVAPAIANTAKVLVYSRAGHGKSDPRPAPLNIEQSNAELEQLIARAQLKPPFILVGHSYGALLIRHFAASHPAQVAGMVFVDPSHERFFAEMKRIDGAGLERDKQRARAITPPRFKADLALVEQIQESGRAPHAGALPDVPSVVLTSYKSYEQPEFVMHTAPAVKAWRALHADFFQQFSNGRHVVTSNSGHNIHLDEPALVIGAVEQVIAAASDAAARRLHLQTRQTLLDALGRAGTLHGAGQPRQAEQAAFAALAASAIDEAGLNSLAYELLGRRGQPLAAEWVFRFNADRFTESDNARDSYGEALLALGRPAEAKTQFLRALALGQANGRSARALDGYRNNLAKAESMAPKAE